MPASTAERIAKCLHAFLANSAHRATKFTPETDLLGDLGLSSDEGIELVLDLCEEFGFDFPKDFNPLVHTNGNRGRTFRELAEAVESMTNPKGVSR